MFKIKFVSFLMLILMAKFAESAVVSTPATKIKEFNSYSQVIDADTLIRVDSPHASCPGGYWLKITDKGFEKNISILLSAFHTQSHIIIKADNANVWPHSSSAYCRISQFQLLR